MDLQKIKQALELARDMMDRQYIGTIETIEDALAELGKTSDYDASEFAEKILNDCDGTRDTLSICESYLHQYAESYHAKKCAECKSKSCETCKWECAYKKDGSNPCLTCKGGTEIFRNWESIGKY